MEDIKSILNEYKTLIEFYKKNQKIDNDELEKIANQIKENDLTNLCEKFHQCTDRKEQKNIKKQIETIEKQSCLEYWNRKVSRLDSKLQTIDEIAREDQIKVTKKYDSICKKHTKKTKTNPILSFFYEENKEKESEKYQKNKEKAFQEFQKTNELFLDIHAVVSDWGSLYKKGKYTAIILYENEKNKITNQEVNKEKDNEQ